MESYVRDYFPPRFVHILGHSLSCDSSSNYRQPAVVSKLREHLQLNDTYIYVVMSVPKKRHAIVLLMYIHDINYILIMN